MTRTPEPDRDNDQPSIDEDTRPPAAGVEYKGMGWPGCVVLCVFFQLRLAYGSLMHSGRLHRSL